MLQLVIEGYREMFECFTKKHAYVFAIILVLAFVFGFFSDWKDRDIIKVKAETIEAETEEETKATETTAETEAEETEAHQIETEQPIEEAENDYQMQSLGEYILTAYCPCEKCCGIWAADRSSGILTASGAYAKANHTVAVDPSVIPYGTVLYINGVKYVGEDCGGAIKGNRIDIYFESHEEALQFGLQTAEVFVYR